VHCTLCKVVAKLCGDIETGKDLPDVIRWVRFSEASWTKDNKGFLYARFPAPSGNETIVSLRDQKIYYHLLGDSIEKDRLIYERPDVPDLSFESEVSKDGRFLNFGIWVESPEGRKENSPGPNAFGPGKTSPRESP
jgi:prolyl oligopeptidase PreP (S9A serine peptidase family)